VAGFAGAAQYRNTRRLPPATLDSSGTPSVWQRIGTVSGAEKRVAATGADLGHHPAPAVGQCIRRPGVNSGSQPHAVAQAVADIGYPVTSCTTGQCAAGAVAAVPDAMAPDARACDQCGAGDSRRSVGTVDAAGGRAGAIALCNAQAR